MKIALKILLGLCIFLFIFSCENEEIKTPVAEVTVNKTQFEINETMIIQFTGVADQVVVYTGDDMHDYDLRDQSNTGFVINNNLFTYAYGSPGTYKVVCVASTANDMAANLKYDAYSFTVNVIDDKTEIEKLSCPQVLYDEVFANKMSNDEWLMVLPRRVKYNNATPAISLTTQRLKFYVQSDSAKIFINGNAFSSTGRYNLSEPVDVLVISHFGTSRPYKLYTINYPEFSSFKLLDVDGTLDRSEFDYSTFTMRVTLPQGTDVSNLSPEFTTTDPTEKVYIGNTEQLSGSSMVDFTQSVTYRLLSTLPGKPEMQAEATVVVNITFQ